MTPILHQMIIDQGTAGMRVDQFVTRNFAAGQTSGLTRSGIQKLIGGGQITINGRKTKPSARLKADDLVQIQAEAPRQVALEPEALPLQIIYEDHDCLVINKEPGMVVHPAAGRFHGTVVNALLHYCSDLQGIGGEYRPGIVHRLDKDTSGAMIIAKSDLVFHELAQQFRNRTIEKEYLALVWGKLPLDRGTIDRPIGRHRSDRKKMSSLYPAAKAREAVTDWQVERTYGGHNKEGESWLSWLRITPRTGRTHQIRVHLADLGYPVVGDKVYGNKRHAGRDHRDSIALRFPRQALHAHKLTFRHPRSGAPVTAVASLPDDICVLLEQLAPNRG